MRSSGEGGGGEGEGGGGQTGLTITTTACKCWKWASFINHQSCLCFSQLENGHIDGLVIFFFGEGEGGYTSKLTLILIYVLSNTPLF